MIPLVIALGVGIYITAVIYAVLTAPDMEEKTLEEWLKEDKDET